VGQNGTFLFMVTRGLLDNSQSWLHGNAQLNTVNSYYPSILGVATAKNREGVVIWMGFTIGVPVFHKGWIRNCVKTDRARGTGRRKSPEESRAKQNVKLEYNFNVLLCKIFGFHEYTHSLDSISLQTHNSKKSEDSMVV